MLLTWGHSYQKKYNNHYFWYPKEQDKFKQLAFQYEGIVLRIVGNDIDIYHLGKINKIIKAPVSVRMRAITIGGVKIREKFENCKIYAVPKGQEDLLKA